jgi:DNA polymerase-3 subunit gamma/tau
LGEFLRAAHVPQAERLYGIVVVVVALSVLVQGSSVPALARALNVSGIARQCVDRSALVSYDDDTFVLRASIRAMTEAPLVAKVRDAVSAHFGRPIRVSIVSGEVDGPTVAGIDSAEQAQRLSQAQAEIQADPFVQALIQDFGAQLISGSVQPTL